MLLQLQQDAVAPGWCIDADEDHAPGEGEDGLCVLPRQPWPKPELMFPRPPVCIRMIINYLRNVINSFLSSVGNKSFSVISRD